MPWSAYGSRVSVGFVPLWSVPVRQCSVGRGKPVGLRLGTARVVWLALSWRAVSVSSCLMSSRVIVGSASLVRDGRVPVVLAGSVMVRFGSYGRTRLGKWCYACLGAPVLLRLVGMRVSTRVAVRHVMEWQLRSVEASAFLPVKLGCDELWSGRACCGMLWPVAPVMVQQGLGRRVNSRSVVAVMARLVTASCSQLRCDRFGCAMPVQSRHVLACLDTVWFVRPVKQKTPEEVLRGLCFKSSTISRWSDRMLSGCSEPSPGNTFLS